MEKQFINEYEYKELLKKTRYNIKKVEDIIDIYEFLKDKTSERKTIGGDKEVIKNLHLDFLKNLFYQSMMPTAAVLTETEEEFLKSNYLSEELKKEICNRLKNSPKELIELLNSDKQINDFSKEAIKEIIESLKCTSDSLSDEARYAYRDFCFNIFEEYLFILDGNGPIEYIKEEHEKDLPIKMLERSNVFPSSSYYSGYDVNNNLLGENHLFSLYKKFVKYYPEKVDEFVRMVMFIPMLTPTEFVTNYLSFVRNGMLSDISIKEGNISFDDAYGPIRDLVEAISMADLIEEEHLKDFSKSFNKKKHSYIIKSFRQKIKQYKSLQESEQSEVKNKTEEQKIR